MSDADEPGAVSLRFRLTEAEYRAALWRLASSLWIYRGFAAATALVFVAGIVLAVTGSTSIGLGLIGAGIVWALAIGLGLFLRPMIQFRRQPRLRGDQFFSFSDGEIRASDPNAESRIKWSFYDGVIEMRDLYLLRVMRRYANILPKRAFASRDDETRFRELVRQHLKADLR